MKWLYCTVFATYYLSAVGS